jgi:broad specificity phosphatase PhoE
MEKQSTISLAFSKLCRVCASFLANRCSAGIRDSELTNHGHQQATRLGWHFKALGLSFTHLFSSHLQRAVKTAGKIREAQLAPPEEDEATGAVPEVVQLPLLVEQDFGSMEGKSFHERAPESKSRDKGHNCPKRKCSASFVDVETKDSMAQRADAFLDKHLLPLLIDDATVAAENCVAIVSHGIFLSTLWKRLLLRLPTNSVVLCSELQATARPSLEHFGGWSNTGYLDLRLDHTAAPDSLSAPAEPSCPDSASCSSPAETPATNEGLGKVEVPQLSEDSKITQKAAAEVSVNASSGALSISTPRNVRGWTTTILAINSKDHLKGLKRTGGGVGSSRHDTSQKSIETCFKRRKVD